MHELAITEGILEAAVPAAKKNGAKKILEIRLRIGELSGVFPECVREYFELLSAGTIAEGAEITVERIPVTVKCPDCGYDGTVDRRRAACPRCGGIHFTITGGREYYVESLKVE